MSYYRTLKHDYQPEVGSNPNPGWIEFFSTKCDPLASDKIGFERRKIVDYNRNKENREGRWEKYWKTHKLQDRFTLH